MIYNQYQYNIYNPIYVNPIYLQQLEIQVQQAVNKQWEQQKKIGDMVKAISDYCSAAREIEPGYLQEAMIACFAEIERQAAIDRQRNGGRF